MKQIVKEIEGLLLNYTKAPGIPTPNDWDNLDRQPAWRNFTNDFWYFEDELDVGGWTADDKTMFLRAAEVQQANLYYMNTLNNVNPATGTEIHREYLLEWFAVTSYPINMQEYYNSVTAAASATSVFPYAPNFNRTNTSFDNVIVGALRYYTYNTTTSSEDNDVLSLIQTHNFGSGSASASDKLYFYRVIIVPTPNDSPVVDSGQAFLLAPSLRFILNADLDKEADYQYIMRLKRSLDLFQEGL